MRGLLIVGLSVLLCQLVSARSISRKSYRSDNIEDILDNGNIEINVRYVPQEDRLYHQNVVNNKKYDVNFVRNIGDEEDISVENIPNKEEDTVKAYDRELNENDDYGIAEEGKGRDVEEERVERENKEEVEVAGGEKSTVDEDENEEKVEEYDEENYEEEDEYEREYDDEEEELEDEEIIKIKEEEGGTEEDEEKEVEEKDYERDDKVDDEEREDSEVREEEEDKQNDEDMEVEEQEFEKEDGEELQLEEEEYDIGDEEDRENWEENETQEEEETDHVEETELEVEKEGRDEEDGLEENTGNDKNAVKNKYGDYEFDATDDSGEDETDLGDEDVVNSRGRVDPSDSANDKEDKAGHEYQNKNIKTEILEDDLDYDYVGDVFYSEIKDESQDEEYDSVETFGK